MHPGTSPSDTTLKPPLCATAGPSSQVAHPVAAMRDAIGRSEERPRSRRCEKYPSCGPKTTLTGSVVRRQAAATAALALPVHWPHAAAAYRPQRGATAPIRIADASRSCRAADVRSKPVSHGEITPHRIAGSLDVQQLASLQPMTAPGLHRRHRPPSLRSFPPSPRSARSPPAPPMSRRHARTPAPVRRADCQPAHWPRRATACPWRHSRRRQSGANLGVPRPGS